MKMPANVARLADFQRRQQEALETPLLQVPAWPTIGEDAFYGLPGRFVRMIEPHTEADPIGILLQFIVMNGNVIGRGPNFKVEADEHHMNLFAVLVGETAKGRKGVSSGQAKRLIESLDPEWSVKRLQQGLSSGEGLIWAVRDPIERDEPIREKGRATGEYQKVIVDHGVVDKRFFLLEAEFASTLRVLQRDGNTLSAIIRTAWDTGNLRTLTKNSPAQATGAHISIVGHITKAELLRYLDSTETANGFGNRFLWCCVKRSKVLPEGGQAESLDLEPLVAELRECVEFSKHVGEIRRDAEARHVWAKIYPQLSEGKPGLLGSMIGRAEAQTMRLACLYALLDRSAIVRVEHLMAALSLWEYCEASARWIFGDALGDPVADEILRALKNCPQGLTRTEIRDLFGRHEGRERLNRALGLLLEQGLAKVTKDRTEGRPSERWIACSAKGQASADGQPPLSHMSLSSQSGSDGDDLAQESTSGDSGDGEDGGNDPLLSHMSLSSQPGGENGELGQEAVWEDSGSDHGSESDPLLSHMSLSSQPGGESDELGQEAVWEDSGSDHGSERNPLFAHMSLSSQSGGENDHLAQEVVLGDSSCDKSDKSDRRFDSGCQMGFWDCDESDKSDQSASSSPAREVPS